MTLLTQIDQDLTGAIKSGAELNRDILRLVKSAFKNAEIEKGSALNEEEAIAVLNREVKKRKESIAAYEQANRPELVKSEQAEIDIIQPYLPAQMSEEDVRAAVTAYLAANPTTPDKLGQAMGALSATLKGKVDSKNDKPLLVDMGLVSKILRESLQ